MYWTIQHASVLDSIESNGVFIPDFGKSELKCPMLCAFALRYFELFNENSSDLPGVIFTFDNTFEKQQVNHLMSHPHVFQFFHQYNF